MTALLICSINLLGSEVNDSVQQSLLRGARAQDSAKVSYDDLRIVNSKLIELEYLKVENNILKQVHSTDSIIIKLKNNNIEHYKNIYNTKSKQYNKVKFQRDIAIGSTGVSIVALILMLLLK